MEKYRFPIPTLFKLGCCLWGDVEDEDEPDENGVVKKKVVDCNKFNGDNGNKVKITSKRASDRRAWAKFGDAVVHDDVGAIPLTMVSTQEVLLNKHGRKAKETKVAGDSLAHLVKEGVILMVCRTCGKKDDHWTSKCPYKDLATSEAAATAFSSTKGAYVPPVMRAGEMRRNNKDNYVRVTNLSEDTRKDDLLELFCTFGSVSRVHVAIDQKTGVSRGFDFVNFVNKDDAERAINMLNGFGYDNLIIRVEWDTPRRKTIFSRKIVS